MTTEDIKTKYIIMFHKDDGATHGVHTARK